MKRYTIGKGLPEPSVDSEIEEVQIDEVWHFLNKKTKNMGLESLGL
ncbi:hypothetical protein MSIBF_A1220002 [groundwater metagenome]|uniref:Uncharacterized protein n=1 Tax=groundwater metagenome TaxID=717931 RepID=A0A098E5X4_9ZZZZ